MKSSGFLFAINKKKSQIMNHNDTVGDQKVTFQKVTHFYEFSRTKNASLFDRPLYIDIPYFPGRQLTGGKYVKLILSIAT